MASKQLPYFFSLFLVLLALCLCPTNSSDTSRDPLTPQHHRHRHKHGLATTHEDPEGVRTRAIRRLLEVFGIHPPDASNGLRGTRAAYEPPQYMVDLYNSIADNGGVRKRGNPYDANVIRSFPHKDSAHHLLFSFNVSGVERAESILQAELHIYKLRPSKALTAPLGPRHSEAHSHLLEVRVYQILESSKENEEDGNRLLDARRVSALSVGWEVFRVKAAVLDWLRNQSTNHGLLLTVRTVNGHLVNDTNLLRIAKRHRHSNKQPILVIFSNDQRSRHNQPITNTASEVTTPESTSGALESPLSSIANVSNQRLIRSASSALTETIGSQAPTSGTEPVQGADGEECSRHELHVDFQKIGWAGWIISPKGYNAYYCKGTCGYPLGQNQRPTNHATVQSIVHELKLHHDVGSPSCVPNKLNSISLLFFENDSVVLRQYDEMVAASCGCH